MSLRYKKGFKKYSGNTYMDTNKSINLLLIILSPKILLINGLTNTKNTFITILKHLNDIKLNK